MFHSVSLLSLALYLTIARGDIEPRNLFTIVVHHSFPDFGSVALDFQSVLNDVGLRATVLAGVQDVGCDEIQPDYLYMISGIPSLSCSSQVTSFPDQTLIDQLEAHDISWRAYFEGYPQPSFFPITSSAQCSLDHSSSLFTSALVTCDACADGTPQTAGNCEANNDECTSWCCNDGGTPTACLSSGGCFLDSIGLDGLVCATTNYAASSYSRFRNPFVSFDAITNSQARCSNILAAELIDFNNLPQYSFYVPNNQHSQGSANVAQWLLDPASVFNRLLQGGYDGIISIVFDSADPPSANTFAVVIDPLNQVDVPHSFLPFQTFDATGYTHASFLRAVEINFGLDVVVNQDESNQEGGPALTDDNFAQAVRAIALRDGCMELNAAGECVACSAQNAITAVAAGLKTTVLNYCVCKPLYFDLDPGTAANQMRCVAPAGVTCTDSSDCSSALCNGDPDQPGTCLLAGAGGFCLFNEDCISFNCDNKDTFACQVSPQGGDCLTDNDCDAGLFCYDSNLYTNPRHEKLFDVTNDFQSFTCQVNACATTPNGDCGLETEALCTPTAPAVRTCSCAPNFVPAGQPGDDLPACVANPCGLHSDFCGENAHCHVVQLTPEEIISRRENQLPVVEPVCTCNDGYVSFSENGGNCVENGCLLFPACADHAQCNPNPIAGPKQGSAMCKCKSGYEGTGYITTGGCHKKSERRRGGEGEGERQPWN